MAPLQALSHSCANSQVERSHFFFKTRAKPGRILSATFGFQSCTLKSLLMDKVLWSYMGFPSACFFEVWSFKQKMRPLGLETCGTFKVTAFSLHGRALNKGERRTWPSSPLWRKTRRFSTKIFRPKKIWAFFSKRSRLIQLQAESCRV